MKGAWVVFVEPGTQGRTEDVNLKFLTSDQMADDYGAEDRDQLNIILWRDTKDGCIVGYSIHDTESKAKLEAEYRREHGGWSRA